MKLPEISVRKPVTTAMVFLAILLIGVVCLVMLPVDLFPEMDLPGITVVTRYEGASPTDVEEKVTKQLEEALATVPDLKHIVSKSREGVSVITLSFEWGTNLDTRANDIRDSVSQAKWQLPEDVEDPSVFQFDLSRFPILVFGFSATESYGDIEDILKDTIADPLKRVVGVGATPVYLASRRQVNVWLDREKLASYRLTPQDVVRAISQENQTIPAGNLKVGPTDYLIRVPGEFKDVAPMNRVVLANAGGKVVRIQDVGMAEDAFEEVEQYVKVNGKPGAVVLVQKQSGANTVEVSQAVLKKMAELVKRLPPDVRDSMVLLMDQSENITQMVTDLRGTLLIGGALAVAVVLIFLRRALATVVIALTIPFSLIIGIILMYFLGYTINMMTLFAMIIGVGMVVDNAIVILENITRHGDAGERPREAAVYGANEVGMAITASTLTTVCVFFPIVFVKGITRILFMQFAIVISIVLMGSLFAALTLTPMLAAKVMGTGRKKTPNWFFRWSEAMFNALADWYAGVLGWALRHRAAVIGVSLAIFVGSFGLMWLVGNEFFPEEDSSFLQGTIHLTVGTRVEKTNQVMTKIEGILREEIEKEVGSGKIVAFDTMCGQSRRGLSFMGAEGPHIGSFMVKLVRKEQRSRTVAQLSEMIRRRLEEIRGLENIERFQISGNDPMAGMILGGEQPITVNIFGEDMETTDEVAERVRKIFEGTEGAVDVSVSRVKGRPELTVEVDRDKASAMGLNVSDISDTIRASFYGREATKFRARGEEYDIFVRLRKEDRSVKDDLLATPVRLPNGEVIRAGNIAKVNEELGPLEIERKDKGRVVNVGAGVFGRSLGEVSKDIKAGIDKLDVPRGVELQMAGQTEEKAEAFKWIGLALGVAFLLVYMVMAAQFESLVDPFVVMFSVPFALTGVIWGLFFGGYNLGVVTLIGVMMLIGVVVNNAIVLVDYTNTLRARGVGTFEAIQQAGRARLRPVLMTALTTIVGLTPMAFGSGQGSETWNPLGLTVLLGLLVSTVITLVIVPVMYSLLRRVAV